MVIPSYNSAQFLPQSLGSVLKQSYAASEIIVVDDGSKDNTKEVVESYCGAVRYLWRPNGGLSAARNTGIANAKFGWVAFLDADDWWDPSKLELQVKALEAAADAVLCYTSRIDFYPDGAQEIRKARPVGEVWTSLRHENCITPSTVVMRRDVCREIGGFNEQLVACEDWDLWFRLGPKRKLVAVDTPVTMYRVSPNSMSGDVERMLKGVKVMLDSTLLRDLRGWKRSLWRRRIWSSQLFRCAIVARAANNPRALSLLLRSFATWPSPFFLRQRGRFFLAYLRQLMTGKLKPPALT